MNLPINLINIKYSDQIEFKAIIENNIKVNDETLKKLQENFIKGNVEFQKGEFLY